MVSHPYLGRESSIAITTVTMMTTHYTYEIRVKSDLANRWSDWFEGLEVRSDPDGETLLRGELVDQSALFGVLTKIHSLNLELISVARSCLD